MIKNNRTSFLEHFKRKITKKYLKEISKEHLEKYDQLATFSFDYISRKVAVDGVYELDELNALKEIFGDYVKDKCIIDVGANVGNHTLFFSKMAKLVFSFEPNEIVFQLLGVNTRNHKNIKIFNIGCSDKKETLTAYINEKNWGAGRIIDSNPPKFDNMIKLKFNVQPLDSVTALKDCEIGLIKVDVEGHELLAFKGMRGILEKYKPIIVFEQNDGISNGTSKEVDFLRDIGYKNIFVMRAEESWLMGEKIPRPFRGILRWVEALLIGYPSRKLALAPINFLDKQSYNLIIMTSDNL